MRNNKNGITLIALIITIIILLILAGVSMNYVTGENGIITNAMKMELETAKGEVRDHLKVRLNEELACAASDLYGTVQDIGTRYNEPALVNYLKGNKNYLNTDHEEKITTACIEEFNSDSLTSNDIVVIDNSKLNGRTISSNIYSKYRIKSEVLCPNGDKYGIGKNISDGNIFTIEAIGLDTNSYNGKYELVYYDKDHQRFVLDTISLYITNQS